MWHIGKPPPSPPYLLHNVAYYLNEPKLVIRLNFKAEKTNLWECISSIVHDRAGIIGSSKMVDLKVKKNMLRNHISERGVNPIKEIWTKKTLT